MIFPPAARILLKVLRIALTPIRRIRRRFMLLFLLQILGRRRAAPFCTRVIMGNHIRTEEDRYGPQQH